MTLYDTVMLLCSENGITKTKLERDCGFSQNSINKWAAQSPSADKLAKVADYFGVSVDYLLGKTDDPTPPKKSDGKPKLYVPPEYASVMVAFAGGTENLTQEDIDSIIEFIEFKKNQKKK